MKRLVPALLCGIVMTIAAASTAAADSERQASVLELKAAIHMKYQFGDEFCPPETSRFARCVRFTGAAAVPGLGATTATYTKILPPAEDAEACPVIQFNTAVLAVPGKGELVVSRPGRLCGDTAPATVGPVTYEVTGGTGVYAGASGRVEFMSAVQRIDFSCNCGKGLDRWSGTLTVPGVDFDVAPPTLTGAVSKTVSVPRRAKRARVSYAVAAQDAADGPLGVTCDRASGSWFRVGQTRVTCSATDSSGNTGRAAFKVTVKRR